MKIDGIAHEIALVDRGFSDLNPVLCGDEICEPGHESGPAPRHCYLLHYVVSGRGTLENPRGKYNISAGSCFVIHPEEFTTYRADDSEPWYYIWLGLTGGLAHRFGEFGDVIGIANPSLFMSLPDCRGIEIGREEYLAGKAFMLLSALSAVAGQSDRRRRSREYADRTANYINQRYSEHISVAQLADSLHLDRRYFTTMFRAEYGISVKEYITKIKLENAKRLLSAGFSVTKTAEMTGYADVFNFSKMYRKHFGESPSGRSRQKD